MGEQLHKVKFDLIRYANCWEDADVLLKALQVRPGGRVLSIGSAGDNSFSLLTQEPEIVVAADLSKVQLNLIELKKAAISELNREEYMAFVGFLPSNDRLETFQRIKQKLSEEARTYWNHFQELIEAGIIHQGKFEKYFRLFAHKILPLIHTPKRINGLFLPKNGVEQKAYYEQHWNNLRWRLLFRIFFGKMVMGRVGRDPEFLKQVDIPVSTFIFQMAEKELSHTKAQVNYMLYYTLNGVYGAGLPHYVREENYPKVKANLDRLHLFQGTAENALLQFPEISYMNLSDIFEYMNPELFGDVSGKLRDRSATDVRIAYWNLMVPREISQVLPRDFNLDKSLSEKLSEEDKGFFYRKFIIDQKS